MSALVEGVELLLEQRQSGGWQRQIVDGAVLADVADALRPGVHEHDFGDELTADAVCSRCSLAYGEWEA